MYDPTDAGYLGNGGRWVSKKGSNGDHCPVCGESINFYPPDGVGLCSCGYNTESAEFDDLEDHIHTNVGVRQ